MNVRPIRDRHTAVWLSAVVELAGMPGLVERIGDAHVPDLATGRCAGPGCGRPGIGTPYADWPCTTRRLAEAAARYNAQGLDEDQPTVAQLRAPR